MISKPFFFSKTKGMTIIEILITLSILVVMIGATLTVLNPAAQLRKSRDVRRKSDLQQYRTGLEAYSAAHSGTYPIHTSLVRADRVSGVNNDLCEDLTDPVGFLDDCPADPFNRDTYFYRYHSDVSGYETLLITDLENGGCWVICSGKSGEVNTLFDGLSFCGVTSAGSNFSCL